MTRQAAPGSHIENAWTTSGAMTMRYARFHADYTDVGRYFDRVALALGRQNAPARVQSRVQSTDPDNTGGAPARQRAAGQQIGKQARQESNLQPPVLETGALPIELRT